MMRCCLTTPDPGSWKAGVDDSADPAMVERMHNIRDRLSYRMPLDELIYCCRAAVQIDSRTTLGGDLQRCLLSNAADRLLALAYNIHPWPWLSYRLRDAWAVYTGKAVAIYTTSTVYDRPSDTSGSSDSD